MKPVRYLADCPACHRICVWVTDGRSGLRVRVICPLCIAEETEAEK